MSLIPFDDRDGSIWFDGQLVPWREASVHVLTHGLHYASSVFEGERVYAGNIFKSQEHTARLIKSADTLDFEIPFSAAEIETAKRAVLDSMGIVDGYIRPVAWRGSEMMGVSAQQNTIHLAVAAWEWPSYFDPEAKMKGIRLALSKWRRPAPETAPVHAKAAGLYMICTLSKHRAEKDGFHDAMMLDYRGYVAEATGANVFFVMKDGRVHTPTPDCFLNGITRRTVIDLLKARGVEVVERHIMPEEMADAEECFLTGTAAEVTPVGSVADYTFTPGALTRQMVEDYDALVRRPASAAVAAE
ncbi:branched-chain amino acid aminotransferase [Thalassobaculum sp. OXR-137]|uniref:branched-chain amino acid aminotransferase n=1 Tax=Thalassobaculum sp. OXR-137 TaxID=3100173 RepID=UPI002AC8C46B|nr:branched-chain amino acid aminotransferase [Thalassobaculum sp. OXR-137]WPZ32149.1 branched-chain amino acid aminotransferase [Thalassobaculum sp. OXR-137]